MSRMKDICGVTERKINLFAVLPRRLPTGLPRPTRGTESEPRDYLWCRVLLQVARFALLAWVGVQAVEALLKSCLQILLIRQCMCLS